MLQLVDKDLHALVATQAVSKPIQAKPSQQLHCSLMKQGALNGSTTAAQNSVTVPFIIPDHFCRTHTCLLHEMQSVTLWLSGFTTFSRSDHSGRGRLRMPTVASLGLDWTLLEI